MKQQRMSSSNQAVEEGPYSDALTIAISAISRRALSKGQLSDLLSKRGVSDDVKSAVLLRIDEMGYLNDLEFARTYSERARRSKKASKRMIANGLRERHISKDIIEWVLEDLSDEAEFDLAQEFAMKKWQQRRPGDDEGAKRRISASLFRKGFSGSTLASVINSLD
jgi:regulatory protein